MTIRLLGFLILATLLASCSTSKTLTNDQKRSAATKIERVMYQQQTDWNDGDLEAFMFGYWNSPELRFVSNSKVTKGWKQTLENYKRGYPTKAAMGELTFNIQDIDILSAKSAIMLGKFTLKYPNDSVSGMFTLTWKKIDGFWKIVSDMTCG